MHLSEKWEVTSVLNLPHNPPNVCSGKALARDWIGAIASIIVRASFLQIGDYKNRGYGTILRIGVVLIIILLQYLAEIELRLWFPQTTIGRCSWKWGAGSVNHSLAISSWNRTSLMVSPDYHWALQLKVREEKVPTVHLSWCKATTTRLKRSLSAFLAIV